MAAEASGSLDVIMEDTDPNKSRNEEIEKIVKVIDIIVDFGGPAYKDEQEKKIIEGIIDLDVSDEISGVLMTVFTCLRKEEKDSNGHNKYRAYVAKIGTSDVIIGSVVDKIKSEKIAFDFMVATPIIELMTMFRVSFDEVRTGVTRFQVRKSTRGGVKRSAQGVPVGRKEPDIVTQNISMYGLINHHIPLLQGITAPPERRTGILRSLGPMAQAILMVMENTYYDKLTSALSHSLQMLPMSSEIINCLKDAKGPGQVSGVLKELGDILLLTTSRSTQKFYFPLILLMLMWRETNFKKEWSFSGAAMLKNFTIFVNTHKLKFQMKSGGTTEKIAQVVFHAMFGTYLEDLTVLSQITNVPGKWFQRKDMNQVFVKRSEHQPKFFTPITFKYVSKMAQSLQTRSLGNADPVATSRPAFSGMRTRVFTQEFLSYLTTGRSAISFTSDPTMLQYALKKLKDSLLEEKDGKLLESGTTSWYTIENNGELVESNFKALEGNVKFYGVNA